MEKRRNYNLLNLNLDIPIYLYIYPIVALIKYPSAPIDPAALSVR